MLNQLVIVGRITKDPELKELENGKVLTNLTLAIPRAFKNAEGVYETDFIDCVLWNSVAKTTTEYTKKGDIVGIKGRIESNSYEKEDGTKVHKLNVIAEKVTFLSSKSQEYNHEKEENMER